MVGSIGFAGLNPYFGRTATNKAARKRNRIFGEFQPAVSERRLNDIVKNKMRPLALPGMDSQPYKNLPKSEKRALEHLVKAAWALDDVFLKQDHPENIPAVKALKKAAATGSQYAKNLLLMVTMSAGLEGRDMYSDKSRPIRFLKGKKLQPGKGFFPQDLTKKEFIAYLKAHPEEAAALLSNNTIVRRQGKRLIAIPYSVAFRDEMQAAAKELQAAADATNHKGLEAYLNWQAQALTCDSDPQFMYNADKAWVALEDSPLEFTIGRESYEDRLTSEVVEDPEVQKILSDRGIVAKQKDSIGVRVGIVNQESFKEILGYRQQMEGFSKVMPLYEQYAKDMAVDSKMTFADVDLVAMTGDYRAFRGSYTVAQNLPNSDKLAVQLKAGSRLVFHRQVRESGDPAQTQKLLDKLIDPSQHKWHDVNADFLCTVGHELAHSLGPRASLGGQDKKACLGKYGDMLEENKADVASIFMTEYFVKIGKFSQEQANQIYLTWALNELPKKRPADDEAHRMRSVMQLNYFIEKGAIQFKKGGKLKIVPAKMGGVGRQMLQEVIQLQLDGDIPKAEAFVRKYAAWNKTMQYSVDMQNKLKPKRYKPLEQPLLEAVIGHKV